jgi:hypothetical protein
VNAGSTRFDVMPHLIRPSHQLTILCVPALEDGRSSKYPLCCPDENNKKNKEHIAEIEREGTVTGTKWYSRQAPLFWPVFMINKNETRKREKKLALSGT